MKTYIGLFRGINVGGKNLLPMKDLVRLLESLGCKNVKTISEEFKLDNKIFYLYAPDGVGRSKLAAKVEQALGVPATARNWNTVSKLIEMVKQA